MRCKILSLFLSIVFLFSAFSVISFAEGEIKGDINNNGKVDTEDARIVLKMACGIIAEDLTIGDFNGDGVVSLEDAILILRKSAEISGVVIPDKNGDNFLSDSPDNEFIELISKEFNKEKRALVAIYSMPDSGTNYVLEFKKSVISSTYEKSPKNLYRVYHIGPLPERKISFTDGTAFSGIEHNYNCTPAEGILTFNLIKTQVMKQYPDYFIGL